VAVGNPSRDELALLELSAAKCPMGCSENLSFHRFPMHQVRTCTH
jgi:hypothetical protein